MKSQEENEEIFFEVKSENPEFNKEDLIKYTKWAIQKIHMLLRTGNIHKININCDKEVINKLIKENVKYRITNDVDNVSIQYVELFDYIKRDDEVYIKTYLSIYFYDNVKNNFDNKEEKDKYWNDVWIVTYRKKKDIAKRKSNSCYNCGATMKYNKNLDIFECEYCGNSVYSKPFGLSWEISDIKVGI